MTHSNQSKPILLRYCLRCLASKETVVLGIQILAFSDCLEHYDFNNYKNEFYSVIMASLINI